MIDLTGVIIHDLSLTYGSNIAGYSSRMAREIDRDGWNAKWLEIYSHAGTHMDAPQHFGLKPGTIDEYRPEELLGKAWIARIEITEPQQLIHIADLGEIQKHLEPGDSLLLDTRWSQHLGTPNYKDDLPRISTPLAHWLVDRKVKMLGVEAPSVADVNNLEEVTAIHEILLKGKVIIIEGLTNLHKIQSDQVFLIALPLKIEAGDGAPARVIALEEST